MGTTAAPVLLPSRASAVPEASALAATTHDLAPRRGPQQAGRLPDLGVQFHGLWAAVDDRDRAAILDRMVASGARWVRLDISWAMVQPESGRYDMQWGVPLIDRTIQAAHRRGLKVLGTFWLTPSWANAGMGERVAPHDPASYGRALAWMAKRYEGKVQAWEVWNEPNSEDFLVGADPVLYTQLLCAAHHEVSGTGADVDLVFGGVMYNDDGFIRATYAAGVRGCFDILAVHPYMAPSDAPPDLQDDGSMWRLRHVQAVRQLQVEFDDPKPIWATEFGWSAHPNSSSSQRWELGVSEQVQKSYAVRTLKILKRDYPYVCKAFWYNDVMKQTGDVHQDGYGMLRQDLTPRPVWQAMRRLYQ